MDLKAFPSHERGREQRGISSRTRDPSTRTTRIPHVAGGGELQAEPGDRAPGNRSRSLPGRCSPTAMVLRVILTHAKKHPAVSTWARVLGPGPAPALGRLLLAHPSLGIPVHAGPLDRPELVEQIRSGPLFPLVSAALLVLQGSRWLFCSSCASVCPHAPTLMFLVCNLSTDDRGCFGSGETDVCLSETRGDGIFVLVWFCFLLK